jgi:predicted nuclease with TOPRIM domain
MVKKMCICVSDWIFNEYLLRQPNRSRFIEEMILKGLEVNESNLYKFKIELKRLNSENSELREQLKRYKFTIEGLRRRHYKRPMTDTERMAEAIKNRGLG